MGLVSAKVVSKEEEYGGTDFRLAAEKPVLVPPKPGTRTSDAVLGVTGLFIVIVILVSSVYFMAKYLF